MIGVAVSRLIADAGCELQDISIRRDGGSAFIAVMGPSGESLAKKSSNLLFKERFAGVEGFDTDNALFLKTNGEGFEEAWQVLGYSEDERRAAEQKVA